MFRLFENELIHRREVQVDTSVWRGLEPPIDDLLPYPGVRAWWKVRSHWYGDEFQEYPIFSPPRGTADELLSRVEQGTVYPKQDG